MADDAKGLIATIWRGLDGKAKFWLLGLACVPVAMVAGIIALFIYAFASVDASREKLDAFMEPMLRHVAADGWEAGAFDSYANPLFRASLEKPEGRKLLARWKPLGKLVEYEGVVGFETEEGSGWVWGSGIVRASFEGGEASFSFEAELEDHRWRLKWLKGGKR